jgi:hypothetical protein
MLCGGKYANAAPSWGLYMYVCVSWCFSNTVLLKKPRETRTLTEAKAQQKFGVAGPTTGCCTNSAACIEEKQRVRQPAVVYTQKCKQTYIYTHTQRYTQYVRRIVWGATDTYIHTHTQVCMLACLIFWGARANQRHTRQHHSSRLCQWSLHVCVCVCWQLSCMLIKVDKQLT